MEKSNKLVDLRAEVEEKLKERIVEGLYDERDLKRFREDNAYAQCFLQTLSGNEGALDDVVEHVDRSFTFRKSMGVNDLTEESFPTELAEREFLYWKGVTNKGQKILHFKVGRHKKGDLFEDVKRYIAFHFEKFQQSDAGGSFVLFIDFTGAGFGNMDMDVVKYIILCFSEYFPSTISYIVLYEMPIFLLAALKLVQTWISESQRKKIVVVRKENMSDFISDDQLEDHMRRLNE